MSADDEVVEEEDRMDRRMWNADLLAGYSLEERVRREMQRRTKEAASSRRPSGVALPMEIQSSTPDVKGKGKVEGVTDNHAVENTVGVPKEMAEDAGVPDSETSAAAMSLAAPEKTLRDTANLPSRKRNVEEQSDIPTPEGSPTLRTEVIISKEAVDTESSVLPLATEGTQTDPSFTATAPPGETVSLDGREVIETEDGLEEPVEPIHISQSLPSIHSLSSSARSEASAPLEPPVGDPMGAYTVAAPSVEIIEPQLPTPAIKVDETPITRLPSFKVPSGVQLPTEEPVPIASTSTPMMLDLGSAMMSFSLPAIRTVTTEAVPSDVPRTVENSSIMTFERDHVLKAPAMLATGSPPVDEPIGPADLPVPIMAGSESERPFGDTGLTGLIMQSAPSSESERASTTIATMTTPLPPPHVDLMESSLSDVLSPLVETPGEASEDPIAQEPAQPIPEADGEVILGTPPPNRKLTRGKAIRRSSSGLQSSGGSISSRRSSKRKSDPPRPLFATASYSFPATSPRPIAAELQASPQPVKMEPALTTTSPSLHEGPHPAIRMRTFDPVADNSASHFTGSLRSAAQPQSQTIETSGVAGAVLLPHREAAMRRRELALLASLPKETPKEMKPSDPSAIPSGPLINFNDWSHRLQVQRELPALGASTAELLQLLEGEITPVAESSAQAAARAAVSRSPPLVPPKDVDTDTNGVIRSSIEEKRIAAPLPPPSRTASRREGQEGLTRKISVLSTASLPITPRPIHRVASISTSPTPRARPPAIPTRRPPPPPLATADESQTGQSSKAQLDDGPPMSPSRPPPPAFEPRPGNQRMSSTITDSTSSSISEKASTLTSSYPAWQGKPRSVMLARPRGPRPPPPPPRRAWAKSIVDTLDADSVPPTLGDRNLSETILVIDTTVEVAPRSPIRSASAQNIASQRLAPRYREYTDLDVLVSRLEGSGREYEVSTPFLWMLPSRYEMQGFSQIASFLGPAKSPAASAEALATLLPGPILVDSRRTTAQGKVKLKLSMLGVRVIKCPICLVQFKDNDKGVMMPECGHVAHEGCATRWFREEGRCFVCRVALKDGDEVV